MSFPRYQKYKSSGISWIGDIPEPWLTARLANIFRLQSRPVRKSDDIVTAFRDGQVTLRSKRREEGFTNALKEIGYQGVRAGDLVIHAMDAFAGAIGVSDSDGKSTPVYSVLTPIDPRTSPRYYGFLLRYMALSGYINSLAKGIRERSTDFRWADARTVEVPCPSPEEQESIIAFLDRETAKIDALIEEQRRLIALLKEKRQAVISHAVMKGLNPATPMKDSGVGWLGKFPSHWTVLRVKQVGNVIIGLTYDPSSLVDEGSGTLVLRSSNIQDGQLSFEDCVYVNCEIPERLKTIESDLLICSRNGSRALIGKNALISGRAVGTTFGVFMTILRGDINPYLRWVLNSSIFEFQSGSYLTATINQLTVDALESMQVPVPPEEERHQISLILTRETERFESLIVEADDAIRLLQERRSALISAAVTGKIDVRNYSPRETPSHEEVYEPA